MGFPLEVATDERIWRALEVAQLSDFVKQLPNQLESLVGERGTSISGGQRQRLGIARAMFTQPKLIVLDEATSALDGSTEADFSDALSGLHGEVTIILIAHRLATVKRADCIYYMESGRVIASGTFVEVSEKVPDFARQIKLSSVDN
jgi:ABC-type bacteriocin/lantibiotic exporter with double-glycine peptidase domain